MRFLSKLYQKLIKAFSRWAEKEALGYIKKHVRKLIERLLGTLKDKFNEYASNQAKKKKAEATRRANDAEKNAESADSQSEREKWKAVAEVWRDVANTFREENEALKKRIEELATEAYSEAEEAISSMTLEVDFSADQTLLTLGEQVHELPSPKIDLSEDNNSNKKA